ncbi:hypothetical protein DXG03_009178 [Asterophora parasitica]|uniref:Uncharacterized protein n=1 Tax=Asterophora parasitica TaxID=117018 RepID=A0A9P7FXG8_9AGAR|nr:hypothetical protein DXG03_009178 [Asterophora parasitica]
MFCPTGLEDLDRIMPRQVLEMSYLKKQRATGHIVEIMQYYIRKDVNVPEHFHCSPFFIRRSYDPFDEAPVPAWAYDYAFATQRGLNQHQTRCVEYQAADDRKAVVPNALEIIASKRQAKKRKRLEEMEAELAGPSMTTTTEASYSPIPEAQHVPDVDMNSPPSPDPVVHEGRGARKKRLTWKCLEQLPAVPTPLPEPVVPTTDDSGRDDTPPPPSALIWEAAVHTARNSFGLFREYAWRPTYNPDDTISLDDLSNTGTMPMAVSIAAAPSALVAGTTKLNSENPHHPFKNSTIYGLMSWIDEHEDDLTPELEDEDGELDESNDEDLGAEDGEDGAGDLEDEEGYAEL